MARGAHETSGSRLQNISGARHHFRRDHVDADVRQGRCGVLWFTTGKYHSSTDDNPFFFYTARLREFCHHALQRLFSNNNAAISVTLLLIVVAFCACGYYIVTPFVRLAGRMPLSALTPPVTYFCAIGMGFMLIEISQMQRLMVFLGHPVYGLAVVLFTILLASGAGSATVGAASPRPNAVIARVVALLTTLAVAGLLTPLFATWARSEATDIRILVSVLLLAPPAFCMGMMFPLGLKRLATSLGASSVLLSRQRDYVDAWVGVGYGLIHRIRHRRDILAGRGLLCRLRIDDHRGRPPGEPFLRLRSECAESGSRPPPRLLWRHHRSSRRTPNWQPISRPTNRPDRPLHWRCTRAPMKVIQ